MKQDETTTEWKHPWGDDFPARAKKIAAMLKAADDQVLKAAIELAQLRHDFAPVTAQLSSAPSASAWSRFCAEHFPQWGARYIRKLIEIGNADDPAAALAEWRQGSRERAAEARAREPEVRTSSEPVARNEATPPEPSNVVEMPGKPFAAPACTFTRVANRVYKAFAELDSNYDRRQIIAMLYGYLPPEERKQVIADLTADDAKRRLAS